MDFAFGVRRFQPPGHLGNDFGRLRRGSLPRRFRILREIFPFDELHGDKARALGLPEIEDANDVAVRDLPGQNQFQLEVLQNLLVARKFGANHFKRDQAVEFPVVRAVNHAHLALSEQSDDLVTFGQHRSGLQCGRRLLPTPLPGESGPKPPRHPGM